MATSITDKNHDLDTFAEVEGTPSPSAPNQYASLREQFRAQRRRALAERTLDLDVPGYDGLVARYNVVEYDWLSKLATRMSTDKRPRAELYGQAATLAQACVEVFARADDGRLVPLSEVIDDANANPVRFDKRLVEFLGGDVADTAIGSVLAVVQDIRVPGHYVEYMEWHSGAAADVDRGIEGES